MMINGSNPVMSCHVCSALAQVPYLCMVKCVYVGRYVGRFQQQLCPGIKRIIWLGQYYKTQHNQLVAFRKCSFIYLWVYLITSHTTKVVVESEFWKHIYCSNYHRWLSFFGEQINMLVSMQPGRHKNKQALDKQTSEQKQMDRQEINK